MGDVNDMQCDGNRVCDTPQVIQISDGLWVRQAIDNMGWIDLGDQLAVVDTLEEAHLKEVVFQSLAETTGDKPVGYVLNTHCHVDHVALNPAFEKRWGAAIISQKNGQVPTGGVRKIQGTERHLEMIHLPGCHTPEDCVVWVPEDKTLFTGDLFGWGLVPYNGNLREGQSELIRKTYQRLISFDAETVIPGHGPICTNAELERWLEYFDWLCATLVEDYRKHMTLKDALHTTPPPEDMRHWWRFVAWKHEDSVKKVFKAVRKSWVSSTRF